MRRALQMFITPSSPQVPDFHPVARKRLLDTSNDTFADLACVDIIYSLTAHLRDASQNNKRNNEELCQQLVFNSIVSQNHF